MPRINTKDYYNKVYGLDFINYGEVGCANGTIEREYAEQRALLCNLFAQLKVDDGHEVLEIGCGTYPIT